MTTVGSLIDRAFRDFLTPPGEQPPRFTLAGSVASHAAGGSVTVQVDLAMLSPEEQDLVAPGVVVEAGSELFLVESLVDTALTLRGGMFDTEPSAHDAGSYVAVLPEGQPSRKAVFDGCADAAANLWPDLWATSSFVAHVVGTQPTELPADCEGVLDVKAEGVWGWAAVYDWTFLNPYPLYSSRRAIQFTPHTSGPVIVTYQARPLRPIVESETLTALNIDESWGRLIVVQAVADVISGVDVEAASAEFITSTLEREGFPVGSGTDLRNALLGYGDYLRQRAVRALSASKPSQVQVRREF